MLRVIPVLPPRSPPAGKFRQLALEFASSAVLGAWANPTRAAEARLHLPIDCTSPLHRSPDPPGPRPLLALVLWKLRLTQRQPCAVQLRLCCLCGARYGASQIRAFRQRRPSTPIFSPERASSTVLWTRDTGVGGRSCSCSCALCVHGASLRALSPRALCPMCAAHVCRPGRTSRTAYASSSAEAQPGPPNTNTNSNMVRGAGRGARGSRPRGRGRPRLWKSSSPLTATTAPPAPLQVRCAPSAARRSVLGPAPRPQPQRRYFLLRLKLESLVRNGASRWYRHRCHKHASFRTRIPA